MSKKRNRPHNRQGGMQGTRADHVIIDDAEGSAQEAAQAAAETMGTETEFRNDGTYTSSQPVLQPPTQPALQPPMPAGIEALATMKTIREAARAIANFKPEPLEMRCGIVLVGKIPAEQFEEYAPQLLRDFGPYIGLTEDGQERPVQPASVVEWARLILKYYPQFSAWLLDTCCTWPDGNREAPADLYFDEKLLLMAALLLINFVNNGAARVFFGAGLGAGEAALKEGIASTL